MSAELCRKVIHLGELMTQVCGDCGHNDLLHPGVNDRDECIGCALEAAATVNFNDADSSLTVPAVTDAEVAALEDALMGLREMIGYVDNYFREKWDLDAYIERAEAALEAAAARQERPVSKGIVLCEDGTIHPRDTYCPLPEHRDIWIAPRQEQQ